ncbi:MAG: HD domain-containing protein [Lachnospiraceae bacterium]|nr:HD domain-containing protein [Lachnospiraceae bacterium]
MYEFVRAHQLNFMLVLCGISGIIALFVLLSINMTVKRKIALAILELGAAILIIFDRFAYIYRGDVSTTGYWMVRISNFMVFFMTFLTILAFNLYLADLMTNECELKEVPKRLIIVLILLVLGEVLVVISQFTGLFYTFDETNHYQRASGYYLVFIIPFVALIVDLSVIIQFGKKLSKGISLSLILFTLLSIVSAVVQGVMYGISINNMTIVAMGIILYIFSLIDMNQRYEKAHRQEVEYLKEQEKNMSRLFEQTATALAEAVDEGKTHSHGHSLRVANYARDLATRSGMDEEESNKVYFAALLHDVGKILIPDSVLLKEGEMDEESMKIFQSHTVAGEKILSKIEAYPYLSEGAHYHHERYDGKGYPDGLKGDAIPEAAKIISVADAYDEMASAVDNRDPLPQTRVREEFIKESGLKFDPKYTKAVAAMIDADPDYLLKYEGEKKEYTGSMELNCTDYRSEISDGIGISQKKTKIKFHFVSNKDSENGYSMPAVILFDSLDRRVHTTEQAIVDTGYTEYGEIWFDGHTICTRAREVKADVTDVSKGLDLLKAGNFGSGVNYEIETAKYKDHVLIKLDGPDKHIEAIAALSDSSRYAYISITGENCRISNIEVTETEEEVGEKDIPRIAEEVLYTDRLESDLNNVQIDGYRTAATNSVPLVDGMRLVFHTMSLPTAHLVWHCPSVVLFTSDDKQVYGPNYREYVMVRLDGEIADDDENIENKLSVVKTDRFESWDVWKERNKKGMECIVSLRKRGNRITVTTENLGLSVKNVTILDKEAGEVYVALSGDQCVLTDIRVM